MTAESPIPGRAVVRSMVDCEMEEWTDPARGLVAWWTLISGDRTNSSGITAGIAEIPVGAPRPARGHWHAHPELYFILSGEGSVTVDGDETSVTAGTAVFIPGNVEHFAVNSGNQPLRLLYVFAADSFDDVEYRFAN